EALIGGWGTLRSWLDEEREGRILLHSLETAASEWERLGKPRDALWGTAALTRASLYLDESSLRPREREFLSASRRAVARGRQLRRAALVAIPLVLGSVYGVVKINEYRAVQAKVEERFADANAALDEARSSMESLRRERHDAFRRFDAHESGAEESWAKAVELSADVDRHYKDTLRELEAALILDPDRDDARELLAETLYERALLAEQEHDPRRVEELRERLGIYDMDEAYARRWSAPGLVRVAVRPRGAVVDIAKYEQGEGDVLRLVDERTLGETPIDRAEVSPGSYLLTFSYDGVAVRYPLVVERDDELEISFDMPPKDAVPGGYIYVPPGRFLFGSADDETLRQPFYYAQPLHQVSTGGFLVGKNEVTVSQWIEYLESLAPAEQDEALPQSEQLSLRRIADGGWEMRFLVGDKEHLLRRGVNMVYEARERSREHDWLKWPVTGVSFLQARDYASWLASSGRLPGARICTEWEWERASRGADARRYPHGDKLAPSDGNYDRTYRIAEANGPDEVGGEGRARSPFGVEDLVGNAYEWTSLEGKDGEVGARGGAFFSDPSNVVVYNKSIVPESFRDAQTGVRICASPTWAP
ncbi:MAG: SUMF1/EgtB/PvdO family nonheme iron enzyme, partial [Myxococcales bacterium]|nr:SUMF1/EgtB/PvdO family nonheme iron enzyme [Myxococcales bacterium]